MQEKESKTKYSKTLAWFIELSIWFLILTIIAFGIIFAYQKSQKSLATYQLFLRDADGIIVGSPVKMMGIHVGHVKKVQIVKDTVFVEFQLDQKGLELPKGSMVTVEFFGMGGSRSIEIYPPQLPPDKNTSAYYIQQPRRLGAALSLLNNMFDKLGRITFRVSSFMGKMEKQVILKNNKKPIPADKILQDADNWLDKTQEKLDKHKRK